MAWYVMDDRQLTVERWIIKAEHDLRTARIMMDQSNPPTDVICYHSQQCIEKVLKAWLIFRNIDFPKTHDLTRLLRICVERDDHFLSLEKCAIALADYAVETRYPDEWRDIPPEEASEAIQWAAEGFQFVKNQLSHQP